MLKLSAILANEYITDSYLNRETNVETPPKKRFQLLLEKPMKNGSIKKELIDISVKDEVYLKYKDSVGKVVEVEVSYFGNITFFGI